VRERGGLDRRQTGRERHAPAPAFRAILALLAAFGLLLAPATAPHARAAEELSLTVASTYTLDPADRAVHVVMDVTARNLKPDRVSDGVVTSYFYNQLSFGIQEEATAIRATSGGSRLNATAAARDRFQALTVRLPRNLNFGQTQRVRITFDLPGGAPRSESNIRVGAAFSTFYAWAWGDAGKSSVTIVIPAGFEEDVIGSPMTRTSDATTIRLAAPAIAQPDTWFVTVDAERPASLTSDPVVIPGGGRLTVRAWPEDAEWRTKVHDLIEKGLPRLQQNIGLDWPVTGDLGVYEVHTPLLEGYAGVYYTESDRIEIGEDLDDLTILHEASHAWFNGDLFSGRWIAEGFADEYASIVLRELGLGRPAPDSVSPSAAAAVRLNAWQHPGRIDDQTTDDRESYGYNASWTTMRALVEEIGIDGMRKVIGAAASKRTAYPGTGAPETVAGVTDWRRFLDLLEEVGGAAGAEALFRRWVTEPHQDEILDDRAAARAAYAALVEAGDGWLAPYAVRSKLDGWDFGRAEAAIDEAEEVLVSREAIEQRVTTLGIVPTGKLEAAYESATVDLADARELAEEQLATLDALAVARGALARERGVFTTIGLIGADPEAEFAAAAAAFEQDDLVNAAEDAADVRTTVEGASEVGRGRAVTAGAAAGGAFVLGTGAIFVARRRRRGRVEAANTFEAVPRSGSTDAGATGPYATLPGDPAESTPAPSRTDTVPDHPSERGDEPTWSSRP
jgi:hypothetical protein